MRATRLCRLALISCPWNPQQLTNWITTLLGNVNFRTRAARMRFVIRLSLSACIGCLSSAAYASCSVPVQINNGQIADASQVMTNFNAVAGCVDSAPNGAANSIQTKASTGGFLGIGPLADGQVLIGATGAAPAIATMTAGTGIAISNGPGSIMLSATGVPPAPALVQHADTRVNNNVGNTATVTLGQTPTPGNLLVSAMATFSNGGDIYCPTGFFPALFANSVQFQGILVCARRVQSGDSMTITGSVSSQNGGITFGVYEFSGAAGISAIQMPGITSGTSWQFLGAKLGSNSYTMAILEMDSSNTFSSVLGASLLFDGSQPGNHPGIILNVPTTQGVTANFTGNAFGNSMYVIISISS